MVARLTPDRTALVIVDVQEKLAAAMPEPARSACVRNVERLVEGAIALDVPILVTEQYPEGLGPTVASVKERLGTAHVWPKRTFSALSDVFFAQALMKHVQHELIVVGMEAHVCVRLTARDFKFIGANVHVAIDATCSRDPENRRIAEGLLRADDISITSTEAVLFELVGSAQHPAFKAISKSIR